MRYGVFGLGDRTYAETFNFGGKRFDEILTELGARRVGERHMHDASSGILPEETALEWCQPGSPKVKPEKGADPRLFLQPDSLHQPRSSASPSPPRR